MNHDPSTADLPAALRLQLRSLRADTPPARDLWPDIAARIAATPQSATAADTPPARRGIRAWPALATAAALALAVGLGWQLRPTAPGVEQLPAIAGIDPIARPLLIEADAMTREYQGALRELPPLRPATAGYATLLQLDASADAVREALAQDPDARFLLQRLQRVYAQRLSLTQRLSRA
ncbi:MAG TPA: hypothetical protein PK743_07090 [Luteimonas sp.]|nr:hypothetical protein [Luteimonas sp.]